MMQRVRELCVLALFLLSVAAPVFTQIHFSPTWGTGKRSDPALPDSPSDACWTPSDLRALLQMIRMVEREVERYTMCAQGLGSIAAYKEQ